MTPDSIILDFIGQGFNQLFLKLNMLFDILTNLLWDLRQKIIY